MSSQSYIHDVFAAACTADSPSVACLASVPVSAAAALCLATGVFMWLLERPRTRIGYAKRTVLDSVMPDTLLSLLCAAFGACHAVLLVYACMHHGPLQYGWTELGTAAHCAVLALFWVGWLAALQKARVPDYAAAMCGLVGTGSAVVGILVAIDQHTGPAGWMLAVVSVAGGIPGVLGLADMLRSCAPRRLFARWHGDPLADPLLSAEDQQRASPEEGASLCSRLSFWWLQPLMSLGLARPLEASDLPELSRCDTPAEVAAAFHAAWRAELHRQQPSLARAMARAFWQPFASAGVLKVVYDVINITVGPHVLHALLAWLDGPRDPAVGWGLVAIMAAAAMLCTLTLQQYFLRVLRVGQHLRTAVVEAVYAKALCLSTGARAAIPSGSVVTLLSVDSTRLQNLVTYLHIAWSAPLQITLAVAFLWAQLGGVPVLSGVAVMVAAIPLNILVARVTKRYQKLLMEVRDERVESISAALAGIDTIKTAAWEHPMLERVLGVRSKELAALWKYRLMSAASSVLWSGLPLMVSLASFGVFAAQGGELTPARAFTSLSLYNLLRFPLSAGPLVINNIVEASVSLKRLRAFFMSTEVQRDAVVRHPQELADLAGRDVIAFPVGMHRAHFAWPASVDTALAACFSTAAAAASEAAASASSGVQTFSLRDASFQAPAGKLTAIVGAVASGKSSLLAALAGDMQRVDGVAWLRGTLEYLPSEPFILSSTIRDNILFHRPMDERRYGQTLQACGLVPDMAQLPRGDATLVGARGLTLSGGQQARVALARAVYAGADVYLLDSVLAALDAHVGAHVLAHALKGMLSNATRLLVTHSPAIALAADHVVVLQQGTVVQQGSPQELAAAESKPFAAFVQQHVQDVAKLQHEQAGTPKPRVAPAAAAAAAADATGAGAKAAAAGAAEELTTSNATAKAAVAARGKPEPPEEQIEEHRERGGVATAVYRAYAAAGGGWPIVSAIVLLQMGATASSVAANAWLGTWADSDADASQSSWYLEIFAAISVAAVLIQACTQLVVAIFGVRSARQLHEQLVRGVLWAPQSFFHVTPMGRILNRVSQDTYQIDETLVGVCASFLSTACGVAGTLLVIGVATPAFFGIMVPVLGLYVWIQRYYLAASRELKRLDSVTRSPLYAQFVSTVQGIPVIRAAEAEPHFRAQNEQALQANIQAYFCSTAIARWLATRLETLATAIICSAAALAVVFADSISPAMAGLSISYALSITQSFNWAVRMSAQVSVQQVSVERVTEYGSIEPEFDPGLSQQVARAMATPGAALPGVPASWPESGELELQHVSMAYRADTPTVLHDISLRLPSGSKLGIVGRTGSGKSSLAKVLFRTPDVLRGQVIISGRDTSCIPKPSTRAALAYIPQHPYIFHGTLRTALDPLHACTDEALWRVLQDAELAAPMRARGGLSAAINEGGSNLSSGERQLLSVARALLRPAKIVVMDEATAALSVAADAALQRVLEQRLQCRTTIIIAHRLSTIMTCDLVAVLERGRMKELGNPRELLANPNSEFAALAASSAADH